jgi:hypothetical protein
MLTPIVMRATYEILHWDDEPDTEPEREGGYTDPNNPWGGFRSEVPDDLTGEAFTAWCAENIETVQFDSLWDAAEFVVDFPGAVWDYCEGDYSTNYRTGDEMGVTLHVDDKYANAVFALAAIIQKRQDENLRSLQPW